MIPTPSCPHAAASGNVYTAQVPAAVATPGALVRWFVRATDSQGGVTRDPPFQKPSDQQYWGVVVEDPSDSSSLPIMEL